MYSFDPFRWKFFTSALHIIWNLIITIFFKLKINEHIVIIIKSQSEIDKLQQIYTETISNNQVSFFLSGAKQNGRKVVSTYMWLKLFLTGWAIPEIRKKKIMSSTVYNCINKWKKHDCVFDMNVSAVSEKIEILSIIIILKFFKNHS